MVKESESRRLFFDFDATNSHQTVVLNHQTASGKVSKSKELKRENLVAHDANLPLHRALCLDCSKCYG